MTTEKIKQLSAHMRINRRTWNLEALHTMHPFWLEAKKREDGSYDVLDILTIQFDVDTGLLYLERDNRGKKTQYKPLKIINKTKTEKLKRKISELSNLMEVEE